MKLAALFTIDRKCKSCTFFKKSRCHRFPPTWTIFGFKFPKVAITSWCQEWYPNETEMASIKGEVQGKLSDLDIDDPEVSIEYPTRKRGPGHA